MSHRQAGLEKNQTLIGFDESDASAFGTLDDLAIIVGWVKAQKAKTKSSFAVMAAVAGALVAARLGENRDDIAAE